MSVTKLNLNNKLINGAFDFWQRGTSFVAITNNSYLSDRFLYTKTGTMVHTASQSSDVPSDAFGAFSALLTPTTAQAVLGVSDVSSIAQRIEGNVLRTFKSKKMVLTFKVKAFKVGIHSVAFRNNAQDRSLIKEYTVLASNVWETKTIRFTHDASGTWLYNTGIGMRVNFTLAAGTSLRTSADTWQTGNFMASTNQVNSVDSLSNTFRLADVCLVEDNEGQTRNPDFMYAGRDYFEELNLCQRYYEKSYDLNDAPGTITSVGSRCITIWTAGINSLMLNVEYKAVKRVSPAVVVYNRSTGAANSCDTNGGADTPSIQNYGTSSIHIGAGNTALSRRTANPHFTADAEL